MSLLRVLKEGWEANTEDLKDSGNTGDMSFYEYLKDQGSSLEELVELIIDHIGAE